MTQLTFTLIADSAENHLFAGYDASPDMLDVIIGEIVF